MTLLCLGFSFPFMGLASGDFYVFRRFKCFTKYPFNVINENSCDIKKTNI